MQSALDGPTAWDSSAFSSVFPTFLRDAGLAIIAIFIGSYGINWYQRSKNQGEDTPNKKDNLSSLYRYPVSQPSDRILSLCNTHLSKALATMKKYGVDPKHGFLPGKDPCTELTNAQCKEWEIIATQLPDLLSAGQCRQILSTMKLIDWRCIGKSRRQRRRAFLLLSAMANAYLWCEPENIVDIIPKNIAIPLCGVAESLGIQPALVHASIVLANWRRLDPKGPVTTDNITTLIDILGGRDEKWFFLLTVEIEYVGARALLPSLLLTSSANELINHLNNVQNNEKQGTNGGNGKEIAREWINYMCRLLQRMGESIQNMTTSFNKMCKQCDPYIFYHRVRPFLSGTKGNPTIPNGVVYEGVYNNEHKQCSGGSAAQSTLLPIFDAALGVNHNSENFISEMRQYMPREHREFILYMHEMSCSGNSHDSTAAIQNRGFASLLKRLDSSSFPSSSSSSSASNNQISKEDPLYEIKTFLKPDIIELKKQYNSCIESLTSFRNTHMEMVKVYIIAEQRKAAAAAAKAKGEKTLGDQAGGKGTGGTGIMSFLKPVRNRTRDLRTS